LISAGADPPTLKKRWRKASRRIGAM
jgi:hypothetical protein